MRPINRDISKVVRTVHRLNELIEALHAEGVRVDVSQKNRWVNNGSTWCPAGFDVTIAGKTFATKGQS